MMMKGVVAFSFVLVLFRFLLPVSLACLSLSSKRPLSLSLYVFPPLPFITCNLTTHSLAPSGPVSTFFLSPTSFQLTYLP